MSRLKIPLFMISMSTAILLAPQQTSAANNLLVILDGSNSMWGQVDQVAKIQTAKDVLSEVLTDLPTDTSIGLMAYGHRVAEDCSDVETLMAIGSGTAAQIVDKVQTITPKGKTPIADSIKASAANFAGTAGQNNQILLISDGIESCDGNPCAEAAALVEQGIGVKVHVVGFDVDPQTRMQLECIAEKGQGRYFDAQDASSFKEAVVEVQHVAQAQTVPAPEPEPQPTVWLEDNFDGEDLAEHWEVINPDPDSYIVEDGELLLIAAKKQSLTEGNVSNIIRLTKDLPKGNWRATAKLNIDFQTAVESGFFGLYDDKDNFMLDQLSIAYNGAHGGGFIDAYRSKALKGDVNSTKANVYSKRVKGLDNKNHILMEQPQPILMRFEKNGRSYISSVKLENAEDSKWVELPALRLLRLKGNLAIGLYQHGKANGETAMMVDWVKIETMDAPTAAQ